MIKVSQQDQIQILELNRPKVNAIDESLIKALNAELDKSESDNSIKAEKLVSPKTFNNHIDGFGLENVKTVGDFWKKVFFLRGPFWGPKSSDFRGSRSAGARASARGCERPLPAAPACLRGLTPLCLFPSGTRLREACRL